MNGIDITKKGYQRDRYTDEQVVELAKCMVDPLHFAENYVMVQDAILGRVPFKLYDYQKHIITAFHEHRYSIALTARQMGKALSLDTPILTPTGFTSMSEIKVGDIIYGKDGQETSVTYITDIMQNRQCYEVEFTHGDKVIADAEHQWTINLPVKANSEITITTNELIKQYEKLKGTTQSLHIKHCDALNFSTQKLAIPAYILGLCLGDDTRNQDDVTCHMDDYHFYKAKLATLGFEVSDFRHDIQSETTGYFNIRKLKALLRENNLLKNKHIPKEYIFNSIEDRLELLRGLMDIDGSIEKSGTCKFYQSDESLITDVRLLLSTLGIKSTMRMKPTTHKNAYSLGFTTSKYMVCCLPRKLVRQSLNKNHLKNNRIYIKSITSVKSVPVRCLQVDNRDHLFLCGKTLVPTHNTSCAAAYILWKAMFEPDSTILIAANKQVQALEIMDRIRFAYENLESYNWLRAGITEYNKGNIAFDNGSRIISRATSPDAGRGLSISLLYLDEFAFVHPNKAQEFWAAMRPTLSTGGSCIVTSTPNNNEDQFAQLWFGAIDVYDDFGNIREGGLGSNEFFAIKVKWDEHPNRDGKWAISNRMQLGVERFAREFECEFVSADDTLINGMALNTLKPEDELFKIDEIRWWEEPTANHVYAVALDPAIGAGSGDYAAIQVYDLLTMNQVAEWRSSKTQIPGQIEVILKILYYIHQTLDNDRSQNGEPEIYWTVENNSCGEAALVVIDETGEENFPGFFVHEPRNGRRRKGLTTTSKNKMNACSRLKSLIESQRMRVRSRPLITELKNYVQNSGSFSAKSGSHDDLISSTLLVIRILQIISHWDPNLNVKLSDAIEIDEMEIAPMPFIF